MNNYSPATQPPFLVYSEFQYDIPYGTVELALAECRPDGWRMTALPCQSYGPRVRVPVCPARDGSVPTVLFLYRRTDPDEMYRRSKLFDMMRDRGL